MVREKEKKEKGEKVEKRKEKRKRRKRRKEKREKRERRKEQGEKEKGEKRKEKKEKRERRKRRKGKGKDGCMLVKKMHVDDDEISALTGCSWDGRKNGTGPVVVVEYVSMKIKPCASVAINVRY